MEPMEHAHKYHRYKKARGKAYDSMRVITGREFENTREHMEYALAYVIKHGDSCQIAKAILTASEWAWGNCESGESEEE